MTGSVMAGPVRMAMVGGGLGAFIGCTHRRAAALDGEVDLVAGWLSRKEQTAIASGQAYGLDPSRTYTSLESLIENETSLPPDERVELVAIVTPNHAHFEQAKACLEADFHVLIEKPMAMTSGECREILDLADDRGLVCAVMYNYTGYPMVREARERIRAGELGAIRKVFVEYHQGWLSASEERSGNVQAEWRTDPARAGLGGALGDIGSHAENIVSFVTGLEIESLCAELTSFGEGRSLDDDAAVLLRYKGGAKGVLTASQICAGEGNGLTLRVYGDKGGLRWRQEEPEKLELLSLAEPPRTVIRGGPGSSPVVEAGSRIPLGHPEGFLEGFANIYRGVAASIRRTDTIEPGPDAEAGRRGVRFIELCVESARAGNAWVRWNDG